MEPETAGPIMFKMSLLQSLVWYRLWGKLKILIQFHCHQTFGYFARRHVHIIHCEQQDVVALDDEWLENSLLKFWI